MIISIDERVEEENSKYHNSNSSKYNSKDNSKDNSARDNPRDNPRDNCTYYAIRVEVFEYAGRGEGEETVTKKTVRVNPNCTNFCRQVSLKDHRFDLRPSPNSNLVGHLFFQEVCDAAFQTLTEHRALENDDPLEYLRKLLVGKHMKCQVKKVKGHLYYMTKLDKLAHQY